LKHVYAIIIILSLFSLSLRGQSSSSDSNTTVERTAPTLAFGVGTLSYFGELNTQNKLNSPLTSRMAFNFAFRQDINYFLEFELDFWTGITSANERTLGRSLNFETQLYGFGIGVNYNFANFLKEDHFIEPVIGVGVEAIGFSAKTDLYDVNGIRYNYWSDGTIRNLPESDPNAEKSVLIQRDYYYESDIKSDDFYNLDKHNTYAIGIPITVGVNMLLNDKWTFRAAMIYHFTTTDLLDGVDEKSGNFEGDAKSDRLIYSTVSIAFNFTNTKPPKEDAYEDFTPFLLDEDEDNDSINDFEDDCLVTPPGVEVDERGCPLDGDKDGIPDYKDQELYSAANVQVDSVGVTITDAVRDLYYVRYYDQTGNYSPIDAETNTIQVVANKVQRRGKVYDKTYAVAIGEFTGDIPADLVNQILSLNDVNTYDQDGTIIIAVGRYTTVGAAISRKSELIKSGITNTEVIVVDKEYNVTKLETSESYYEEKEWAGNEVAKTGNTIYRIQIGAFSKKADESKFAGLPNVVSLTSEDGITRYYTGLYTDYNAAAKAKIDLMINNGMNGIFIVSFTDGKSKSYTNSKLSSTGTTTATPLTEDQKNSIKFRVQLGSFKRQIPTDELEHYMELGNIKQYKGDDRYIRYTAGEFDTYKEASNYKAQLRNEGYKGCYVVGEYDGKIIPAKKAKELRNN